MINKDAKQETIEIYQANLKNIETALKMRGIKYSFTEGSVIIEIDKYRYTYSLTRRKWRRDTVEVLKGEGLKDLLHDLDMNKG